MSGSLGGRPTKEQSRAGFEAEVLRLYRAGKPIGANQDQPGTICSIMKSGRTTIWRIVKRAGQRSSTVAAEIREERKYQKESTDEFLSEPAIKEWVEDMKLRRVKKWPEEVRYLRRICEELQIFPDQLVPMLDVETGKRDFTWSRKWLATKSEVPLDKLRLPKVAFRAFAKKYGATDYELTMAGFDAKHYGVGKWKHVQLTEEQVSAAIAYLSDRAHFSPELGEGREEALFAFRFGIETCRTLEPIWGITADRFSRLETELSQGEKRRIELIKQLSAALPPGMGSLFAELLNVSPESLMAEVGDGKKILYTANLFRKKTEKSGAGYKTAYMSETTFLLGKVLGSRNGNKIMNGFEPDEIYPFLRQTYTAIGARASDPDDPTSDYFQTHPIHALRHCGAQRLLQKTGYNRAVVAELGGWEAEKTLEDHYGGVPLDIIRGMAGSLL